MLALLVKIPTTYIVPATFRLRKIRCPSADPKYYADHGPLPHISAGHVIQQKYSMYRLYGKYVNFESAVRNSKNLT